MGRKVVKILIAIGVLIIVGILAILALAWATSSDRRAFPWRAVLAGLFVQIVLAWSFLKLPLLQQALLLVNRAVLAVEAATREGTSLVFGFLGGGPAPWTTTAPESARPSEIARPNPNERAPPWSSAPISFAIDVSPFLHPALGPSCQLARREPSLLPLREMTALHRSVMSAHARARSVTASARQA